LALDDMIAYKSKRKKKTKKMDWLFQSIFSI
jgi:hypothetical protein